MYEFLRNLFASEQPVLQKFNVVDPTAVGDNIRSLTLAYTPSTTDSPTSVVSLYWSDSQNKVYEKQFQDESQAQKLFGAMQGDLEQAARLSKEEKLDAASSLVSSLLKRYDIYTDEIINPDQKPVTTTNANKKKAGGDHYCASCGSRENCEQMPCNHDDNKYTCSDCKSGLVESKIQNPLVNKTAKVVMQNLFFETPEELMSYQEKLKGKGKPGKEAPQVGDFKDDLKPLDDKMPLDDELTDELGDDGLAPSSLSYDEYEKGQADEQKSLTKRIEREVKDQVKSALERKIASTFEESDDALIDAMRAKGRTWEEIKEYFIKELKYDKDSVAAYIDALREAEHGGPVDPLTPPKKEEPLPSAPKPPEDLVSPETHDQLVKELDEPESEPKEIEKQDMAMTEIARQDTEIKKVAEEPLETIPSARPGSGSDWEFLPKGENMSDDMVEDPSPSPETPDAGDQTFSEKVNPGDKVYVMADYETGEQGYEGTLVSMYKQSGDEWAVIDAGHSQIKEVPMRMVKRADFGRLVKFLKVRKAARLRKEAAAKKRNTELDRIVQEAVYGWQINIMDIGKVYAVAEAAYRAGKDVKLAVTELLKMIAKPSDVPAAPGNPPMPTASDELKAITAELKDLEIAIDKEADSSVVMPMLYAIRDKDILDYANGSIYANKIASGQMNDEDWQTLVKETGRWMPHVGRDKTSQHFPQNAEWNFDVEQIAKIKNMFQNLPAQSSLKAASGCSVKDCTSPVEETLNGKPYCKKHLWGIDPKKKTAGIKCPECGSTNVTPASGHKLNKCDSCHWAFDNESAASDKEAAPTDLIYHLLHSTETKGNHRLQKTWCGKDSMMPYTEIVPEGTWEQVPPAQKCPECDSSYQSGVPKTATPDMTECDGCGKPLSREKAVKSPRGQGVYDYFCGESCQKAFHNRGETYLEEISSKTAAPGDKPQAPVDPKAPIVEPVKLDVHKKAPPGMREEDPTPATPEVAKAYDEVRDVMHKLELIERSTQGMLAKVSEEIKKFETESGKSALISQHKAALEQLFGVIAPMKAKVVEVEDSLINVVNETTKEVKDWTTAKQLKMVLEKFPDAVKYLENALNGLQSGAKEIEKRRLVMFPKSHKLSRFDKRASFEDILKNVMDNLNAAFQAISAVVPEVAPEPTMASKETKLDK